MIALLDGDAFYCSCERLFIPSLNGKPLVVLSNNLGNAVARSEEAKALGIKMGQPFHEFRYMIETHGLVVLSPNYSLYSAISGRMFGVASGMGEPLIPYSIDEAFIGLDGIKGDLRARACAIRERVMRWVGVPVGVGIGPTKTLAKAANRIAKASSRKPGSYPEKHALVCDMSTLPRSEIDSLLEAMPVTDVWGVGPRYGAALIDAGICNALALARMDLALARRRWSVVLERTILELRGIPCIGMEATPPSRKQIAHTRAFGAAVTELGPLEEAISEYASRAAVRLRQQGSLAGNVLVFVGTSPFRKGPQYSQVVTVQIPEPTCDTLTIVRAAVAGIRRVYAPGYDFVRAGVILQDLCDSTCTQMQLSLDGEGEAVRSRTKLMKAVDTINSRFGPDAVKVGSGRIGRAPRLWTPKETGRTPDYMTCWDELPVVRA